MSSISSNIQISFAGLCVQCGQNKDIEPSPGNATVASDVVLCMYPWNDGIKMCLEGTGCENAHRIEAQ